MIPTFSESFLFVDKVLHGVSILLNHHFFIGYDDTTQILMYLFGGNGLSSGDDWSYLLMIGLQETALHHDQ